MNYLPKIRLINGFSGIQDQWATITIRRMGLKD